MGREHTAMALLPLFQAMHESVRGHPARPTPWLTWYPYVSTKSTIRERDGRLHLRISDHLQDAPDPVLRGLFAILLGRLHRIPAARLDPADVAAYRTFVDGGPAAERRSESRRLRGRKHIDPGGRHRSLLESYLRVTLETGLDLQGPPRLSWSKTASRRRFGHQDPDHDCIVLSRILDDPDVPAFVLDYVLYHELLHIVHPPRRGAGGKRVIHHKTFRAAEARFPRRDEAERWLARLARRRRRIPA